MMTADIDSALWQFIRGFLVGQVVFIISAIALFQYLFLRSPFDLRRRQRKRQQRQRRRTSSNVIPLSDIQNKISSLPSMMTNQQLLQMFKYNPGSAAVESCQWLNIWSAQLLENIRLSSTFNSYVRRKLDNLLNDLVQTSGTSSGNGPDAVTAADGTLESSISGLVDLSLSSLTFGQCFPCVQSAKVNYSESGRLRYDLRIDYAAGEVSENENIVSVGIEGMAVLNWPVSLVAGLPFSLVVNLKRISGTLSVEVLDDNRGVQLTFLHDARFDIDVASVVGDRTKLKDLSKLSKIIVSLLQTFIEEEIVWPNSRVIPFPDIE